MKNKRVFLESPKHSDSYVRVWVYPETGEVELKLASCDRVIYWQFGRKGEKRGIAKIKAVKKIIDEVHDYLVQT